MVSTPVGELQWLRNPDVRCTYGVVEPPLAMIGKPALLFAVTAMACAPNRAGSPAPERKLHTVIEVNADSLTVELHESAYLLVLDNRDAVTVLSADTDSIRSAGRHLAWLDQTARAFYGPARFEKSGLCAARLVWYTTSMDPPTTIDAGPCSAFPHLIGSSYRGSVRTWLMVLATTCPITADQVDRIDMLRSQPADLEGKVRARLDRGEGCITETTLRVR